MARTHSAKDDFFFCPVCHTELPKTARSCPECGSDDETGWKDSFEHAEEEDFDYDEYLKKESAGKANNLKPQGVPFWVWILAVLLLAGIALTFLV